MINLNKKNFNMNYIMQYVFVYLMLAVDGSFFFVLHEEIFKYIIISIGFIMMLLYQKYREKSTISTLFVLIVSLLFVRYVGAGGIGMSAMTLILSEIMVPFLAYKSNEENFITVYVKLVSALSLISLVLWGVSWISPSILTKFLTPSVAISYGGSTFYGKLFYVMRDDLSRNCGIYTEPGRFQVILNVALFFLLFYRGKIKISDKQYFRYVVIVIIALISAQSTTGYITFLAIVLGFILVRQPGLYQGKKIKTWILILLAITFSALVVDFNVHGSESIISKAFLSKTMSENTFDLNASTGKYRLASIQLTWQSIIKHPLGVGYENLEILKSSAELASAGNGLLSTMAALGVVPVFYLLLWMFKPVFFSMNSKIVFWVFFIMLLNTTLSQTYLFYPSYIAVAYASRNYD